MPVSPLATDYCSDQRWSEGLRGAKMEVPIEGVDAGLDIALRYGDPTDEGHRFSDDSMKEIILWRILGSPRPQKKSERQA